MEWAGLGGGTRWVSGQDRGGKHKPARPQPKSASKSKPKTKPARFRLEEATIDDLHQAIRSGQTTVVAVVQHYLARVRAYNGVASMLVTSDGAPVAGANGTMRPGSVLRFPTQAV